MAKTAEVASRRLPLGLFSIASFAGLRPWQRLRTRGRHGRDRLLDRIGLLRGYRGPSGEGLSWTGTWDTQWRGGGASVTLEEHDGKVTGEYPAYGGKINGVVHDRDLTGVWIEGPRSGGIDFVMASDGRSFMGQFDNGEWWTGSRVLATSRDIAVDQSASPRGLQNFRHSGRRGPARGV